MGLEDRDTSLRPSITSSSSSIGTTFTASGEGPVRNHQKSITSSSITCITSLYNGFTVQVGQWIQLLLRQESASPFQGRDLWGNHQNFCAPLLYVQSILIKVLIMYPGYEVHGNISLVAVFTKTALCANRRRTMKYMKLSRRNQQRGCVSKRN